MSAMGSRLLDGLISVRTGAKGSQSREAANSVAPFFVFNIKIWNIKNILIIEYARVDVPIDEQRLCCSMANTNKKDVKVIENLPSRLSSGKATLTAWGGQLTNQYESPKWDSPTARGSEDRGWKRYRRFQFKA